MTEMGNTVKMTSAERRMMRNAHASYSPAYARWGSAFSSKGTHFKTIEGARDKGYLNENFHVTSQGLRAAGILDEVHAEALAEDERRTPAEAVELSPIAVNVERVNAKLAAIGHPTRITAEGVQRAGMVAAEVAPKMSKTQRYVVLSPNEAPANRGILTAHRHSTIRVLVANGWAIYPKGWPKGVRKVARCAYVTSQGLRAAGYDFDTLHAAALAEDAQRVEYLRMANDPAMLAPLRGTMTAHDASVLAGRGQYAEAVTLLRDAHSSAVREHATEGL